MDKNPFQHLDPFQPKEVKEVKEVKIKEVPEVTPVLREFYKILSVDSSIKTILYLQDIINKFKGYKN